MKKMLTGQRFGRLLVLYDTGERKNRYVVWRCRCDCGGEVDVTTNNLASGHTKSCGCYNRERTIETHTIHGMARHGGRHPVYIVWRGMLQRCENPNALEYRNYGGRGIKVCDEWHEFISFRDWALAHGWQKGLTLDRIDNNAGYSPDNCHWTTRKAQARNRRTNRLVTFNGKTQTIVDWAEEMDISYSVLSSRINKLYWPIECALTEPVKAKELAR